MKSLKVCCVKEAGTIGTYNVEMNSKFHNFILSNGVVSGNSHSVVYSHNSYYTAFLKTHYPAAFMASVLKSEQSRSVKSTKQGEYIKEALRMGIKILPPHINKSGINYKILDDKTIIMGFNCLNGVGEKAAEEIINNQPYDSVEDFFLRVNSRTVTKPAIQASAEAGCFDSLGITRKNMYTYFDKYRTSVKNFAKKCEKDGKELDLDAFEYVLESPEDEWDSKEIMEHEVNAIGRYVSGNLFNMYKSADKFNGYNTSEFVDIKQLADDDRGRFCVEGIITGKKEIVVKKEKSKLKGRKFARYILEDESGDVMEMIVWPDDYDEINKKMQLNCGVRAICKLNVYEGEKAISLLECIGVYSI